MAIRLHGDESLFLGYENVRFTAPVYADAFTNTKKYKIDAGGRVVSETDEEGNVKSYTYDNARKVLEMGNWFG